MKKSISSSPLSEAIRAANHERENQQVQKTSLPESKLGSISTDKFVNLSIKVTKSQRLHWLIEAKKEGTNLTQAILEALQARFGNARFPDDSNS